MFSTVVDCGVTLVMYSDSGMWVSLVHSLLMFGWASLLFDITMCCSDCLSALMS